MQLCFVFEEIDLAAQQLPVVCPTVGCNGTAFRLHQQVVKSLRDPVYHTLVVCRYRCVRCGHTFRMYPHGVTHAYTSHSMQNVAAALYLLGLSYGAVSAALDALKIYLCKSRVHAAVQTVYTTHPDLARCCVFAAVHCWPQQHRVVQVLCRGQWLPLSLISDGCSGFALAVSTLSPGIVAELHDQIRPLLTAIGGQVVLNDASHSDTNRRSDPSAP